MSFFALKMFQLVTSKGLTQTSDSSFWIYNNRFQKFICLMFVSLSFITTLDHLMITKIKTKLLTEGSQTVSREQCSQ